MNRYSELRSSDTLRLRERFRFPTFESLELRLQLDSTVVFNELMYNAVGDDESAEWIELHNQMSVNMDLSGWRIEGGVRFEFPNNTTVPAAGYLVVAADPNELKSAAGIENVFGPFRGQMRNRGDELRLVNNTDRLMDQVSYTDRDPWPVGADGSGMTLAKVDPQRGSRLVSGWSVSAKMGGTPGAVNFPLFDAAPVESTLIPIGSAWNYEASGSDLGTDWRDPSFNDSNWAVGQATLLAGQFIDVQPPSNDVTQLPLVSRTAYFRKTFQYDGSPERTSLSAKLFVDDGAVVYLNGQEAYRHNVPDGPVSSVTFADFPIADPELSDAVNIRTDALIRGTNVIAIEVHQAWPDDTDMAMALELIARETPSPPGARSNLVLNEIASSSEATFRIELANLGDEPIDLAGYVIVASGGPGGRHMLDQQMLNPAEFLALDELTLGFDVSEGDRLFLFAPDMNQLVDAQRVTERLQGRSPEHDGRWLFPARATFGASNVFELTNDIVINEVMYRGPTAPAVQGRDAIHELTPLVPSDAKWRFSKDFTFGANDLPYDPGADWASAEHAVDNRLWFDGQAPFGFSRSQSARINTRLSDPQIVTTFITSYYFELDFDVTQHQIGEMENLLLRHIIDDGAVFHLNGTEIDRFNMPAGMVDVNTLAAADFNLAQEVESFIPRDHLVPGTNRLSVEVHQSSTSSQDVFFGVELLGRTLTSAAVPSAPPVESNEEWIELFNRGGMTVDLSGWRLGDAVEFVFPAGTELRAGQYLVVANNATSMKAKYPAVSDTILGSFSGRLSDGDDQIRLFDSNDNPADEVHYFDDGRWPASADGGRTSLELRDPWADNSSPESWAASDESGNPQWRSYSYQAPASNPRRAGAPRNFHELVIGLLDEGAVLIDDIHVIEEPDGARIERLQNGDFENDQPGDSAAAWRIIGNHDQSHVVVDPDSPSNLALKLVATGATEHMHNHAETTFAGGANIANGAIHEISFRAKWLSGSNQLNTRLFFNRAARTTLLDTPDTHGTPGEPNTSLIENIGPTYDQLTHFPLVPSADETVTISIHASDPHDVVDMTLHYSVNDEAVQSLPMTVQLDGRHVARIPGQRAGRTVQFYVQGTDSRGATSYFPVDGPDSRALYRIPRRELDNDQVQSLRVIMTPDDSRFMHTISNVMSNDRLGATVILNDREVFYDVGIRLRASGYGRSDARTGFNIRFDPAQKFRGVHRTIALDRGTVLSNADGTGGVSGVPGASPHELLIYQIAHRAGQLPAMYDDVVYLDAPRSTNSGMALLKQTRYSNVYLDSQFENGGDGALFKYELVYHSTSTVGGDPEDLKNRPGAVLATEIIDLGDDKEAYRMNFVLRNNRERDDFRAIIKLGKAFSLTGDELDQATQSAMDVDQWMRVMALHSLTGGADTYNMGLAHNLMLYVRPSDDKVLAAPWDVDHGFFHATNSNILGRGGSNLQKVINLPHNKRLFYKHLLDMIETSYNPEYLTQWIEHYTQVTGFQLVRTLTSYVDRRSRFVLGELDRTAPRIPFDITTNDGADFSHDGRSVTLSGQGWIDVHEIRLAGSNEPLNATWIDQQQWRIELPLSAGANKIALEAYDLRGESVGTDSIVVTSTATDRPLQDLLRITEIMFNPPPPTTTELAVNPGLDNDDFEFIELTNISKTQALILSGVQITDGPSRPFVFANGVSLQPGERVVVAGDRRAFRLRYGNEPSVAGQFTGRLNNDGETIRLLDDAGVTIVEVAYGVADPWPARAQGVGGSLELIDPTAASPGQMSKHYQWRASADFGGSPGTDGLPTSDVVINEVVTNTDALSHMTDSIELYNRGDVPVDVSGWYLSDSAVDLRKYRIAAGTVMQPGEYVVLDESHFNSDAAVPAIKPFALSGTRGDDVWLVIADEEGRVSSFVDDIHFGSSDSGRSLGRSPNATGAVSPLKAVTLGRENTDPAVGPIVISEVNYNPGLPSDQSRAIDPSVGSRDLEFIELYNRTSEEIALTDWAVQGGMEFDFEPEQTVGPGQTLVIVPFNPDSSANALTGQAFRAHYGLDDQVTLVGGYTGRLSDDGDRITLERLQMLTDTDSQQAGRQLVDEVIYDDLLPWPLTADGLGQSLNRVSPVTWSGSDDNWSARDPTPGSTGLFHVAPGDANLDRRFDQRDIVFALASGKYQSGRPASWSDGDWNEDGFFDQLDIVAALQTGNYLQGPYAFRNIVRVH